VEILVKIRDRVSVLSDAFFQFLYAYVVKHRTGFRLPGLIYVVTPVGQLRVRMRVFIAIRLVFQIGIFGLSEILECVFRRNLIGENDIDAFIDSIAVLYAYYSVIVVRLQR